jgi:hypothetical protein
METRIGGGGHVGLVIDGDVDDDKHVKSSFLEHEARPRHALREDLLRRVDLAKFRPGVDPSCRAGVARGRHLRAAKGFVSGNDVLQELSELAFGGHGRILARLGLMFVPEALQRHGLGSGL